MIYKAFFLLCISLSSASIFSINNEEASDSNSSVESKVFDEDGNLLTEQINVPAMKIRLQIYASKLVTKAENIAENAARGLYPTDAPCKYALKFESSKRKVGRPSKPK